MNRKKHQYTTPEQDAYIQELKVNLLKKIADIRHYQGLTQKNLEAQCGVRQPMIARMENGDANPQITTLLRLLVPLGMTITIVPLDHKEL